MSSRPTSASGANAPASPNTQQQQGAESDIARFLQRHGVQPLSGSNSTNNNDGTLNAQASTSSSSPNTAAGPKNNNTNNNKASSSSSSSPLEQQQRNGSATTNTNGSRPSTATDNNNSLKKVASGEENNNNNNNNSSPQKSSGKSSSSSSNNNNNYLSHNDDEYSVPWTDVYDSGIVTVDGNPNDVWSIDDYADNNDATVFRYPTYPFGGGIPRNAHMNLLQTVGFDLAQIPFTPCRPYLKEPPPTNLPLESFDLRVIYDAGRTGFEDNKDFPITPGTIIAGRYKITEYIGSAAFSRAVQAIDLKHNAYVCVKIVRNSKDFFDQSLDEIKLLHYINCNGDPDENHVVQLYDFFYFKEHVFLVCELLRDNLYEFGKYNREHETDPYFTLPRLQKITKQILEGLVYVHSLNLLHCDLKPENVLIKSYSRCEIKVIDFGSSCFTTDNLSSYIQSRCYRAPEVVLGCKYDGRIDIWSLGAMLPELATGHVLFHNDTLPQMLGRISAILGPFPPRMVREGRHSCRYVTRSGLFYEVSTNNTDSTEKTPGGGGRGANDDDANSDENDEEGESTKDGAAAGASASEKLVFYYPKPKKLEELCGYDDADYLDFIRQALTIDHTLRPTAAQLLQHPFITKKFEGSECIAPGTSSSKLTHQQNNSNNGQNSPHQQQLMKNGSGSNGESAISAHNGATATTEQ